MRIGLLLIPVLSAFAGWLANWMAVKLLFRPRQPRKILGITLQGVFPKHQRKVAEKLGRMAASQLFSFGTLEEKITDPGNLQKIMPHIEEHIDQFLRVKLAEQMPMISMFIGERTLNDMKRIFTAELETLFPIIMQQYLGTLRSELDLEKIIVEKLAGFPSDKLDDLLSQTLSRQLRYMGMIGAAVGFLIGLLQILVILR